MVTMKLRHPYTTASIWSSGKITCTGANTGQRLVIFLLLLGRDEDPVMAKKPYPGLYTSNEWRFLKLYKTNILDNIKSLLFCFHTFGVRRTIDVLDSDNQPGSGSGQIRNGSGSGALGLTGDV